MGCYFFTLISQYFQLSSSRHLSFSQTRQCYYCLYVTCFHSFILFLRHLRHLSSSVLLLPFRNLHHSFIHFPRCPHSSLTFHFNSYDSLFSSPFHSLFHYPRLFPSSSSSLSANIISSPSSPPQIFSVPASIPLNPSPFSCLIIRLLSSSSVPCVLVSLPLLYFSFG